MNAKQYEVRDDAIQHEIIQAIESSGEVTNARAEYDIEAIANETITCERTARGWRYFLNYEPDEFWTIVAANAA